MMMKMKRITKITKNIIPYLYSLPLLLPLVLLLQLVHPSSFLLDLCFKIYFVYFGVGRGKRGGQKK